MPSTEVVTQAANQLMGPSISTIPWPKFPYQGLNFYCERDARLFCERDKDIRNCADILLGFGVKILILQGSSGSGKSSFLRAGLIPYLKQYKPLPSFFLNTRDSVIRCTADPLREIANALVSALRSQTTFATGPCHKSVTGEHALVEESIRRSVSGDLERAVGGPRERLAGVIADALVAICADLPGKLILVLDQVEEVLTRTTDGATDGDTSAAFFRFLEEVYLRNVDVRVLVSLRTEYYGRFRDELRICDDRLSARPKSGGVQPYLLWPLREPKSLLHVVATPTHARNDKGPVYDFKYEAGLIDIIVKDLLQEFPHGSVTPALQVVCASLFECLTLNKRTITRGDYDSLGGLTGIINSYVERGLSAAIPEKVGRTAEVDKWRLLLHSLVSRQGGGTVVSLSETSGELARRARDYRIQGDVNLILTRLASGRAPLLRGEPPDSPREFGLKHDVLAVVLSRWHDEHDGVLKARKAETAKLRKIIGAICFVALAMTLGAGAIIYDRNQNFLIERRKNIELTTNYAMRSPRSDFRLSLLLIAANLRSTQRPANFYERVWTWISRSPLPGYKESVDALRSVFVRSPWWLDTVRAAGLDPDGRRVALLRKDALEVLAFPSGEEIQDFPKGKLLPLAEKVSKQNLKITPAAGFIAGLGPAAFVNGWIYYWDASGRQQELNIWPELVSSLGVTSWIRVEFIAGRLQATSNEIGQDRRVGTKIVQLTASDLLASPSRISTEGSRRPLGYRGMGSPSFVFSTSTELPELFGYLDEALPEPEPVLAGKTPTPLQDGILVFGPVDRQTGPNRIEIGPSEHAAPEGQRPTLAFLTNKAAAIVKRDDFGLDVFDLTNVPSAEREANIVVPRQHIEISAISIERRTEVQVAPWMYTPLAAVQISKHVRAAWLDPRGVWAVENSDEDPLRSTSLVDGMLLAGERGGTQLQFTTDGEFLMLLQQQRYDGPVTFRIWDLRPTRRARIYNANTEKLLKAACDLVRREGHDHSPTASNGAFTEEQVDQFRIDRSHREPCSEPEEGNEQHS